MIRRRRFAWLAGVLMTSLVALVFLVGGSSLVPLLERLGASERLAPLAALGVVATVGVVVIFGGGYWWDRWEMRRFERIRSTSTRGLRSGDEIRIQLRLEEGHAGYFIDPLEGRRCLYYSATLFAAGPEVDERIPTATVVDGKLVLGRDAYGSVQVDFSSGVKFVGLKPPVQSEGEVTNRLAAIAPADWVQLTVVRPGDELEIAGRVERGDDGTLCLRPLHGKLLARVAQRRELDDAGGIDVRAS